MLRSKSLIVGILVCVVAACGSGGSGDDDDGTLGVHRDPFETTWRPMISFMICVVPP